MSTIRAQLLMIKGLLSEADDADQRTAHEAANTIRGIVAAAGAAGLFALDLVGLEAALRAEEDDEHCNAGDCRG